MIKTTIIKLLVRLTANFLLRFLVKNSIDFSVSFYNYHEPSIYPCL